MKNYITRTVFLSGEVLIDIAALLMIIDASAYWGQDMVDMLMKKGIIAVTGRAHCHC